MRRRSDLNNRRARWSSALVALLYVLLSTVGAVTHSHGFPNAGYNLPGDHPTISVRAEAPHCPVCEWQGLSVVPPAPAPVSVAHALLSLDATSLVASLTTAIPPRSAARAPPLA